NTIDTKSGATMGRSAILEGPIQAAELLLDLFARLAGQLESLDHGLRLLITYRAGGDFKAIADGIVLIGLERERIVAIQAVNTALRHREGIVCEVDTLFFFAPFIEREVDDP